MALPTTASISNIVIRLNLANRGQEREQLHEDEDARKYRQDVGDRGQQLGTTQLNLMISVVTVGVDFAGNRTK